MDTQRTQQRNRRRRERAQRIQAERDNKKSAEVGAKPNDDSADESPTRVKPTKPPNRRKKAKEPLYEEDIIDGFAILAFRSYEDLEVSPLFLFWSLGRQSEVGVGRRPARRRTPAAVGADVNLVWLILTFSHPVKTNYTKPMLWSRTL